MHSTALNVHDWRKTETDVPRLSISEVQGQICSIKRKVSGINDFVLGSLHSLTLRPGGEPDVRPAVLQCSA
jgi:hypothetical protein